MKATFQQMQEEALEEARAMFPAFHSAHEGFAALLEEVDELKAEVWMNPRSRDYGAMLTECLHVAAMAQRLAEDIAMKELP